METSYEMQTSFDFNFLTDIFVGIIISSEKGFKNASSFSFPSFFSDMKVAWTWQLIFFDSTAENWHFAFYIDSLTRDLRTVSSQWVEQMKVRGSQPWTVFRISEHDEFEGLEIISLIIAKVGWKYFNYAMINNLWIKITYKKTYNRLWKLNDWILVFYSSCQ